MSSAARRRGYRRRDVLTGLAMASCAFAFGEATSQAYPAVSIGDARLSAGLRSLLQSDKPELLDFAVDTYATCVFGKIKPPSPPLEHAWLVPGGGYFAQWLWDTMFVADLLAVLPRQDPMLRGVFQNYWDFQTRWSAEKPERQRGMIANFIAPFEDDQNAMESNGEHSPRTLRLLCSRGAWSASSDAMEIRKCFAGGWLR